MSVKTIAIYMGIAAAGLAIGIALRGKVDAKKAAAATTPTTT